jgi:hypothetical protein
VGTAMPDLKQAFAAIGPQWNNVNPTGNENNAFAGLEANAAAGNPYAPKIGGLADDLLSGGTDRTGMVQGSYDTLKGSLTPYTTMNTDPYSNEAFSKYAGLLGTDATNSVKAQYEAAGYNPSAGTFGKSIAEGVGRAIAPVWAQERNNLEAQKMGAINGLYQGGNTTAGLLSGLDQTALGNRTQGVNTARDALAANDAPFNRMLDIEAQSAACRCQHRATANLILPMAQLGGTSNTDSFSNTTKQMSPVEMAQGWTNVAKRLVRCAGHVGGGGAARGWF